MRYLEQYPDGGYRYLRRLREGLMCDRRRLDHFAPLVEEARAAGLDVGHFQSALRSHAITEAFAGDLERTATLATQIAGAERASIGAGGCPLPALVFGDLPPVAGFQPHGVLREAAVAAGAAPVHETRLELPIVTDVSSSFYLHLEVADQTGVLARVATVLGEHEVSVKSVVQRGTGSDARLVMVIHECLESRFAAAVEELAGLDELRSPPRSIRVIEEEYSA